MAGAPGGAAPLPTEEEMAMLAALGGVLPPGAMPPGAAPAPVDPAAAGLPPEIAAMLAATGGAPPAPGAPPVGAMPGGMPPGAVPPGMPPPAMPGPPGGVPGLASQDPATYMQLAQQAVMQDAQAMQQQLVSGAHDAMATAAAQMGVPMPDPMGGMTESGSIMPLPGPAGVPGLSGPMPAY